MAEVLLVVLGVVVLVMWGTVVCWIVGVQRDGVKRCVDSLAGQPRP